MEGAPPPEEGRITPGSIRKGFMQSDYRAHLVEVAVNGVTGEARVLGV